MKNKQYQKIDTNDFLSELYGVIEPGLSSYMIDDEKTQSYINKNWEGFSKSEISELHKYFNFIENDVEEYNFTNYSKIRLRFSSKRIQKLEYVVTKMKDEWYYVTEYISKDNFRYYKCDQFNGLISLFDNKLNKKNTRRKFLKKIISFESFKII